MASYLRPRRGKKATAESQNIILKRGEVFFEAPTGGVGTGIGKIKMGDGTTAYKNLPYFLEQKTTDVANTAITFSTNSSTDNTTLLNAIASGAKLNVIIGAIKKLLTQLNNDFASFNTAKSSIISSALGKALSMTSTTTIADIATKIAGVTNRGAWTNTPTTSGKVTIPKGYHNGSGYVDTTSVYNAGGGGKITIPYLKTSNFNSSGEATADSCITIGGLDNFKTLSIEKTSIAFTSLYIGGYTSSDITGVGTPLLDIRNGTSTGTIANKTFDITNYSSLIINISRYCTSGTARAQIDNIVIS